MDEYICKKCGKVFDNPNVQYCDVCGSEIVHYQKHNKKRILFSIIGVVAFVIIIYVIKLVEMYNEGLRGSDDIAELFIGKTVPLYDTSIVVTDENISGVTFPDVNENSSDKFFERRICVCLELESGLTTSSPEYACMTSAFYATFRFGYKGWELVSINKGEIFDEYWENDDVNPKVSKRYPHVYSDNDILYGHHWSYYFIRFADNDERPGFINYLMESTIREYRCLEFKDGGNYIKCMIDADHYNLENRSIDDWKLYLTLEIDENGEKRYTIDACEGALAGVKKLYD